MTPVYAWIVALAVATSSAPPAGEPRAAAGATAQVVSLDVGPPLARRMGVRITVRRAGDDPVMHRPVAVHDLPRSADADDVAPPLRLELPPGEYLLEAESPGYLPSTRAVTVDAGGAPEAIAWAFLPDSVHRTVRFRLVSPAGVALDLGARHLADEQEPVACTARAGACELRLRPGRWELQVGAPGHRPLRRVVVVGDAEQQGIDLSLETDAAAPAQPDGPAAPALASRPGRRRLVLGLSLASVPLVAAGLPLTILGPVRYRQLRGGSECASYGAECADAIIPQIHVGAAGAGLLGAAVGLAATGITAARARGGTAWWVELGVGGALVAGGGAWLIGNSILLDRELKTGPLADIDARTVRRPVSSFMLGAGLGLVGGGLTAVLLRRKAARAARFAPYGGPGQAGLLLTGQF